MPPRRPFCKHGHNLMLPGSVYVKGNGAHDCMECRKRRAVQRFEQVPLRAKPVSRIIPQPSLEDRIWAAGFFEGEGTVTISRSGGKKRSHLTRLLVTTANTTEEFILFLRERWGGSTRKRKPQTKRSRPAFEWTLGGGQAIFFLRDIEPYIKACRNIDRLKIAFESEELRRSRGQRGSETRSKLHGLLEAMRVLNKRGVEVR